MNISVLNFAGCLVLSLAAGSASAAVYRFVPGDADWSKVPVPAGVSTMKYTSLATAVTEARAGDTVWVKDGYVCDTGATTIGLERGGKARLKLYNAAFTLRSESGYVDEANGKGAYIRGEKVVEGGFDNNNVRPIWAQNAQTVIQGFVLENGATGNNTTYGLGGAVYGGGIVSNCVIRNCSAVAGGAFGSTRTSTKYVTAYNTVISNCQALSAAAAVKYGGGAVYGAGSLYNCTLVDNVSASYGGAVCDENTKGFVSTYSGCVFRGNRSLQSGGTYCGEGTVGATFSQCRFTGNEATESGAGGVSGKATLIGCVLSGNKSANGAAAFSAETAEECYSCAFAGNSTTNGTIVAGDATTPLKLYNCTFADNASSASCVSGATIENGIIWGNTYGGSELTDCTVTYSCVKGVSGAGNIDANPQLTDDYRLGKTSPCIGKANPKDWMTTAGDARAFDVADYPRIRGTAPDLGAYERESPGAMVIGR